MTGAAPLVTDAIGFGHLDDAGAGASFSVPSASTTTVHERAR